MMILMGIKATFWGLWDGDDLLISPSERRWDLTGKDWDKDLGYFHLHLTDVNGICIHNYTYMYAPI